MAGTIESLVSEVISHIDDVSKNPSTPLDHSLLDNCKLSVERLSLEARRDIALKSSLLLPSLRQDPTLLAGLLEKLLEPFSFSEIQDINPNIDYTAGLAVEAPPYNGPTIVLLKKATYRATDAENVASSQGILLALVRLWLRTPDVKIASQAEELLLDILKADRQPPEVFENDSSVRNSYMGAVWRRLFGDKDVYEMLYTSCTMSTKSVSQPEDSKQVSLAQGRLLSWLPKVASLKWNLLLQSHHQEVESRFQSDHQHMGILRFAATCMVDKSDVLMHMLQIEFYCALLRIQPQDEMTEAINLLTQAENQLVTPPLDFLANLGVHHDNIMCYISGRETSSPTESLIYRASARYAATFAEFHVSRFLKDWNGYRSLVLNHICEVLNNRQDNLEADMHVLASIPRVTLVDGINLYNKEQSPIVALLNLSYDENMFNTISTIVKGPDIAASENSDETAVCSNKQSFERSLDEGTAARTIYFVINSDPSFWKKVVQSAMTISLDKTALAAIHLIRSVASASWPTPRKNNPNARTPSQVSSVPLPPGLRNVRNPSGAEALCHTPVKNYLLYPYTSYDRTRNGTDSAEYKVGMAKYESLKVWVEGLKIARQQMMETEGMRGGATADSARKAPFEDSIRIGEKAIRAGPFISGIGGGEARAR